jgi:hypothetical protein
VQLEPLVVGSVRQATSRMHAEIRELRDAGLLLAAGDESKTTRLQIVPEIICMRDAFVIGR